MNAENNPFQIPSCFKLDIEQQRRERFKKTVVTAVIISVALVVGLLIEGCVSEKSQAGAADKSAAAQPASQPLVTQENPQSVPLTTQGHVPAQPCPVATVPPKAATPVVLSSATGGTVYIVKSGDTLTRIAKTHGLTLKALRSANDLPNDRIVVGEKLKLPTA
jgi:LysM repeat protein